MKRDGKGNYFLNLDEIQINERKKDCIKRYVKITNWWTSKSQLRPSMRFSVHNKLDRRFELRKSDLKSLLRLLTEKEHSRKKNLLT